MPTFAADNSQNVILGGFGEVVLLDWGFAKGVSECESDDEPTTDRLPTGPANINLTMAGEAVGTPAYMAPEQATGRNDEINTQTDVYGLGAMLYEVLTGQPPFSGEDTKDVLLKVLNEDPVAPSELNHEVPNLLEKVCLKALSKSTTNRQASATDLADEVERWQEVQRKQVGQTVMPPKDGRLRLVGSSTQSRLKSAGVDWRLVQFSARQQGRRYD